MSLKQLKQVIKQKDEQIHQQFAHVAEFVAWLSKFIINLNNNSVLWNQFAGAVSALDWQWDCELFDGAFLTGGESGQLGRCRGCRTGYKRGDPEKCHQKESLFVRAATRSHENACPRVFFRVVLTPLGQEVAELGGHRIRIAGDVAY